MARCPLQINEGTYDEENTDYIGTSGFAGGLHRANKASGDKSAGNPSAGEL